MMEIIVLLIVVTLLLGVKMSQYLMIGALIIMHVLLMIAIQNRAAVHTHI